MRNAKGKIAAVLICLAPFAAMFGLTKLFFQDSYLLEWMLRHWYLGIWVIAAITAWMNAKWGYALSYSYALAVVFGQVTGEFIRNCNIAKVTAEMTNQEIARLHHHPGFQLWMAAFALLMVLFGVFSLYQKSRKAQRKDDAAYSFCRLRRGSAEKTTAGQLKKRAVRHEFVPDRSVY